MIYSNNSKILLGVNIDHVATIRQARGTLYPDPLQAAWLAEQGGADSITVHLREDRRHIQERDVELLRENLNTRLNLEMAATPAMLAIAQRIRPQNCCLVPENREELTTEGGLNIKNQVSYLADTCAQLTAAGIRVSLFIDADEDQIAAAHEVGATAIEIHTGRYAEVESIQAQSKELIRIQRGVEFGLNLGLQVNAGHGLHYHNTAAIAAIPGICELNIGHAIIARAIFTGLTQAVRAMKEILIFT